MEATDREEKSEYRSTEKERLELVKSLVSLANTDGGQLHIKAVKCNPAMLDSARLDDLVNKYVEPPLRGITSDVEDGYAVIEVPKSVRRPHIFVVSGSYKDDKGKQRPAFYPGQVFVRHSSKTEPADGEDMNRILTEATAEVVSQLGQAIQRVSGQMADEGIPVTIGTEGLFTVSITDPNREYPYTTTDLGEQIGKGVQWVARAARVFGLYGKPEYCWLVEGASGVQLFPKYNEAALDVLRRKLELEPEFNPYTFT